MGTSPTDLPACLDVLLEHIQTKHPQFTLTLRIREKRKSIGLSLRYPQLTLSVPTNVSLDLLEHVMHEKTGWILRQLDAGHHHQRALPRMVSGQTLLYLGRHLRLMVRQAKGKTQLEHTGFTVCVSAPDPEACRAALLRWYRARAQEILLERVALFSSRMGVTQPPIHVRDQKTRWGSCSRSGELRFNWRIVMAPIPLLDYVVVHELCHLKFPHHGTDFWRMLECLMPDFEHRKRQLESLGSTYDL